MVNFREMLLSMLNGAPVALVDELRVENMRLSEEVERNNRQIERALAGRDHAENEARVLESQAGKDASDKEAELLLLQLHQVQEELEEYFVKWQEEHNDGNALLEEKRILEVRLNQALEELEHQFVLHQQAKALIEEYAETIDKSKVTLLSLVQAAHG